LVSNQEYKKKKEIVVKLIAGFRNILIHEYLDIDWDEVYKNLQRIDQFYKFIDYIKKWLSQRR